MTSRMDPDLIALATPYALHAVTEPERADIERRLAGAPPRSRRRSPTKSAPCAKRWR